MKSFHTSYKHPVSRAWHSPFAFQDTHFIFPLFIVSQPSAKIQISSMPEIFRYGTSNIVDQLRPLIQRPSPRLQAVILFGVVPNQQKDPIGNCFHKSPVIQATKNLKSAFPDLLVCVDICLCEYTSHGHCGTINQKGQIKEAQTIKLLAEMSVLFAKAGADMICPSDMMDNRIYYIRKALNQESLFLPILSYSSKFFSCFYGPFREAAGSAPSFGDRSTYQLPPVSRDLAIRAAVRDIQEGADFVMVKPGLPYLDIIRDLKNEVRVPIATYQVSGEYSMMYLAGSQGLFDLRRAVFESFTAFQRAGASVIISYFTPRVLDWLSNM